MSTVAVEMTPITATAQVPSSRSTTGNQPEPTKLKTTASRAAPPTPYAFQSTVSRCSTAPRSSRHQTAATTASDTTRPATERTRSRCCGQSSTAAAKPTGTGTQTVVTSRGGRFGYQIHSTGRTPIRATDPRAQATSNGTQPARETLLAQSSTPVATASRATTLVDRTAMRTQPTVSQPSPQTSAPKLRSGPMPGSLPTAKPSTPSTAATTASPRTATTISDRVRPRGP